VGWLVTSEERARDLAQIKKLMDLGCPPLMQGIAQAFLEDDDGYRAHRARILEHYRALRDATLDALERHMPKGVSWTHPEGGFQLWVTLPQGYSSVELFLRAVEKGAAFLPGPLQDINNRFMNSFRLCYGSLGADEIAEGIKRLADATREFLSETPGDTGFAGLGDF
jgi:2-aminoadipate transaminase